MITYEDECVECPTELGCMGSACPNRNVKHLYCDKCGCEEEKLYKHDGEELCADCPVGQMSIEDFLVENALCCS